MAWGKSAEDKAAEAAERDAKAARDKEAAERRAWAESPAGQARQAAERGDTVFQLQLAVGTQRAHIVPDRANPTALKLAAGRDVNRDLNSVAAEGWDLVNGSVSFVTTGGKTREGAMGGEHTSTSGQLIGHYLFRRRPTDV